jgi:hypothetical protein
MPIEMGCCCTTRSWANVEISPINKTGHCCCQLVPGFLALFKALLLWFKGGAHLILCGVCRKLLAEVPSFGTASVFCSVSYHCKHPIRINVTELKKHIILVLLKSCLRATAEEKPTWSERKRLCFLVHSRQNTSYFFPVESAIACRHAKWLEEMGGRGLLGRGVSWLLFNRGKEAMGRQ